MNQYEFWFRLRNVVPIDKALFVCVYHELRRGDMNRSDLSEVLGVDVEEITRAINGLAECGVIDAEWDEEAGGFHVTWIGEELPDPWLDEEV